MLGAKRFASLRSTGKGLSNNLRQAPAAAQSIRSISTIRSNRVTSVSAAKKPVTLGSARSFSASASVPSMAPVNDKQAGRPPPDQVFEDIAEYVYNYKIDSQEASNTARLTLMDTIGCMCLVHVLWSYYMP